MCSSDLSTFVPITHTCRRFRFTMILHALFGSDSQRFAAMLGSFAFLYKFILNSLPFIHIPDQLSILYSARQNCLRLRELDLESGSSLPSPPGTPRTGLTSGQQTPLMMRSRSAERKLMSEKNKGEEEGRRKSRLSMQSQVLYSRLDTARWHAVVAGAIAGLSVLWEKKSRRITIAQQVFVR